jgi:TnpA family transposase
MLYMEKDLRCCAGGGESRTSGAQRGREETCRKVTRLAPTQLECAIFLCKYLSSEALRQEIEEGLNVIENWNSANDFIWYGKGGEIATNNREEQEIAILSLHLLQICLVYINTPGFSVS